MSVFGRARYLKEPYEMSMAWEPDRRYNFFDDVLCTLKLSCSATEKIAVLISFPLQSLPSYEPSEFLVDALHVISSACSIKIWHGWWQCVITPA